MNDLINMQAHDFPMNLICCAHTHHPKKRPCSWFFPVPSHELILHVNRRSFEPSDHFFPCERWHQSGGVSMNLMFSIFLANVSVFSFRVQSSYPILLCMGIHILLSLYSWDLRCLLLTNRSVSVLAAWRGFLNVMKDTHTQRGWLLETTLNQV